MPGHRYLLLLRLVRLVPTAPRAQVPAKGSWGRHRGQHPAGSGGAARAGSDGAGVPGAQHGVLMPGLRVQVSAVFKHSFAALETSGLFLFLFSVTLKIVMDK